METHTRTKRHVGARMRVLDLQTSLVNIYRHSSGLTRLIWTEELAELDSLFNHPVTGWDRIYDILYPTRWEEGRSLYEVL